MAIPDKTESELRKEIKTLVEANSDPVLSESQIDILVRQSFLPDKNQNAPDLAFERVSSKEYTAGERIVPMNRNGHVYVCTTAGTSSASEPTFPGDSEEVVTDGTVEWTESGVANWIPTYDVYASISDGWGMKAAKCVGKYRFSSNGQSFDRQQVYEHCMEQAKIWRLKKMGTTNIVSSILKNSKKPDAFSWQLPEQILEDRGWI